MSEPPKKNKVIFYYPQHFNRDASGENPLFRPFVEFCKTNNISYKLVEEPDKKTIKPYNPQAIKFNLFFVLICRKLIPSFLFKNFELREQYIGKIYRLLTANYYAAETVFTLSNSLGGFWRGYNPQARIIDYQHGIINKTQSGFFENSKAPLHIRENKKEVAVWGQNFKAFFNQDKDYYTNKVHVLGYFLELTPTNHGIVGRDKILFTLQMMPDIGINMNQSMLNLLKDAITQFKNLPEDERPSIILKNHPRHNHVVDLKTILKDVNFVQVLPDDSEVDTSTILINVTYFSTAAFEMAKIGVPSFFLFNEELPQGNNIFLRDYSYPIQQNQTLLDFWTTYKNHSNQWVKDSKTVKDWVSEFFEPFNKGLLRQLIANTRNEHKKN